MHQLIKTEVKLALTENDNIRSRQGALCYVSQLITDCSG